jgi:hypothetical protein
VGLHYSYQAPSYVGFQLLYHRVLPQLVDEDRSVGASEEHQLATAVQLDEDLVVVPPDDQLLAVAEMTEAVHRMVAVSVLAVVAVSDLVAWVERAEVLGTVAFAAALLAIVALAMDAIDSLQAWDFHVGPEVFPTILPMLSRPQEPSLLLQTCAVERVLVVPETFVFLVEAKKLLVLVLEDPDSWVAVPVDAEKEHTPVSNPRQRKLRLERSRHHRPYETRG